MTVQAVLHVAVGVITNPAGAILITRRAAQTHQGGLWEFPGGKVEAGETVEAALRRELQEELDLVVRAAEPWLQVRHAYARQSVLLDVWRVTAWDGAPWGREGQPLAWVLPSALADFAFPAADEPIIARLRQQEAHIAQHASSNGMLAAL